MGQIIGITGVIIIILIVVATISYRWYLKSKEKRTILKKWTMAYPQTTVVRQVDFLTIPACFQVPKFFSDLNSNCSNLLDIRNLQEQVKKLF